MYNRIEVPYSMVASFLSHADSDQEAAKAVKKIYDGVLGSHVRYSFSHFSKVALNIPIAYAEETTALLKLLILQYPNSSTLQPLQEAIVKSMDWHNAQCQFSHTFARVSWVELCVAVERLEASQLSTEMKSIHQSIYAYDIYAALLRLPDVSEYGRLVSEAEPNSNELKDYKRLQTMITPLQLACIYRHKVGFWSLLKTISEANLVIPNSMWCYFLYAQDKHTVNALMSLIKKLQEADIFTQENLNWVIQFSFIWTSHYNAALINKIPNHQITQFIKDNIWQATWNVLHQALRIDGDHFKNPFVQKILNNSHRFIQLERWRGDPTIVKLGK